MLKSAMTLAASQVMRFTGEIHVSWFCIGWLRINISVIFNLFMLLVLLKYVFEWSVVCFVCSTETINDGEFHTVELVTFDQMVNLSIDGGRPTTMDSFGKEQPLRGETPLYVGGKDPPQMFTFISATVNCNTVNHIYTSINAPHTYTGTAFIPKFHSSNLRTSVLVHNT